MTTKERKKRADGERSRNAILREAAQLATVEGLAGLSIGRLAEAVGMSKSGLFAHFGSKEELQLATIDTASAIFKEEVLDPAEAAPSPEDMPYNPVNQISLRLDSLDTLRGYRQALLKEGIAEQRVTDHGNAWSIYFKDPEGNPVELYVDSPFYTPQPCGEPFDIDLPNDEIVKRTEAMCRSRPRFMTREAWMESIQARLDSRS